MTVEIKFEDILLKNEVPSVSVLKNLIDTEGNLVAFSILEKIVTRKCDNLIIFGPPGVGKSTLAVAFTNSFRAAGIPIIQQVVLDGFFKFQKAHINKNKVLEWSREEYEEMLKGVEEVVMEEPVSNFKHIKPRIVRVMELVGLGQEWESFLRNVSKKERTVFLFVVGHPEIRKVALELRPKVKDSDPKEVESLLWTRRIRSFVTDEDENKRGEKIQDKVNQSAPPVTMNYYDKLIDKTTNEWMANLHFTHLLTDEPLPEKIKNDKMMSKNDYEKIQRQFFMYDIMLNDFGFQGKAYIAIFLPTDEEKVIVVK